MLRLRRVQDTDCALLFAWANDPRTRLYSIHSEPIAWETHVAWFQRRQGDSACLLFIAEDEGNTPIGQIRFDLCGNEAEVGISLDTRQRGKGYGASLITEGIAALAKHTTVQTVHAWIKPENLASQRAFERAGFSNQGPQQRNGLCLLHYTLPILHKPERLNT